MATKKTPARKAAAKKTPAKKASVKKAASKTAAAEAPAKRPYNRKKPLEKKVSPLKGRKYGPRKPKAEAATDAPQQPQHEAKAVDLDSEVQSILDSIGCPPCDELMEQSELTQIDILDLRGMTIPIRVAFLNTLEMEGYITTTFGLPPTHNDVLLNMMSVEFLALNHVNRMIREANPKEVDFSQAVSIPVVKVDVEVAFSKAAPSHPMLREINGATYVRVA